MTTGELFAGIAIVLLIGAILVMAHALADSRKEHEERDKTMSDLCDALNKQRGLYMKLHESRTNGIFYSADQVEEWLHKLGAIASLGRIQALKLVGLWDAKAFRDQRTVERCIACRNAITHEGAVVFVPAKHQMCIRCVVKATADSLQRAGGHDSVVRLLRESTQPSITPDAIEGIYAREDESIGASDKHKAVDVPPV